MDLLGCVRVQRLRFDGTVAQVPRVLLSEPLMSGKCTSSATVSKLIWSVRNDIMIVYWSFHMELQKRSWQFDSQWLD